VRYPGVEMPRSLNESSYEVWRKSGRQLRPARDTGLALDGRRAREARRRAAQQRQQVIAGVVAVLIVGAALVGWQYSSDKQAAKQTLRTEMATASPPVKRTGAPAEGTPVVRPVNPSAPATPYFASYKSLKLRLPVSVDDLTEVGFHQASYAYALHLKTRLDDADMTAAKHDRSTHRDKASQPTAMNAYLVGEVLRMWRDRPGKPDSAVDVGANPGSPVLSPVTGTVVKVKRYKLYGQFDDYEVHIQPDGHPGLDVVMIHLNSVTARPGDRVVGGASQLAQVRRLPKAVASQLRSYTKNHGYHTHIQVNDATDPKYKGLKDAIRVEASVPATRQPLVQ